ncbi:MFS transporter [Streptomyces sp. NPDC090052]|uniref:MFS transporter n=1 Tax=unclassified Streptomyces TaxID=2593676 RepID=UPI002258ACC0|nr:MULTISPECIES: MFS transporter [unclassified Streptomyces]MCX4726860.1 MFS transporter [Streptomyces sp. NBC_01306]WSV03858.1 MFS transporter [Streptomyces sp. NBC_01020]WSX70144.1 MFS transporter [Streptomyces sp. NBC_00932]
MADAGTSSPPTASAMPPAPATSYSFDDAPLNRFHLKVTALTFGANFSDGYQLGVIGIALTLMAPQMGLGAVWQGMLGASALIGIFVGSIGLGWLADRMGRQKLYTLNFALITVASVAQIWANSPELLFALRVLIGVGIGADYAIGPTLVAEFCPRRHRGFLLASLTALWTIGYICSFFLGHYITGFGGDSWRWLLGTGAIPAAVVLVLRIGTPESPRWLVSKGRIEEARAVVARYIGPNVDFESVRNTSQPETSSSGSYRDLFSREQWRATTFGILYYNCQVIPYFAIYTFLPVVLAKFAIDESVTVDGLLNGFLFLGSVIGLWCVARFSRRAFVTGSFIVMALALGPMGLWPGGPKLLLFVLFLVFTLVMSAASNLDQVYPPELFPTPLRGSGVGLLNGLSRVGSAAGTFLLPLSIDHLGFATSMTILASFLVLGAIVSAAWAPETAGAALD